MKFTSVLVGVSLSVAFSFVAAHQHSAVPSCTYYCPTQSDDGLKLKDGAGDHPSNGDDYFHCRYSGQGREGNCYYKVNNGNSISNWCDSGCPQNAEKTCTNARKRSANPARPMPGGLVREWKSRSEQVKAMHML